MFGFVLVVVYGAVVLSNVLFVHFVVLPLSALDFKVASVPCGLTEGLLRFFEHLCDQVA